MKIVAPHLLDAARWKGMRIGLVGGSFNPPHEGHLHISLEAVRTLQLDVIWWLVTPQNPLKDASNQKPYETRMDLCRKITAEHPAIIVTDIEKQMNRNYTCDTVAGLRRNFPGAEFVFITGMDNALSFHKWKRWQDILKQVPTAHIARPPASDSIRNCPLRQYSRQRHIQLETACRAELKPGLTYWLLKGRMMDISSTQIRNRLISEG